MRFILFTLFFISLNSIAGICDREHFVNGQTYKDRDKKKIITVSKDIFDHGDFLFASGSGPYGTYFTLDIPFLPIKSVNEQLKGFHYKKLKNRGEAHITVLTPIEYHCYFAKSSPKVSMDDIENLIRKRASSKINYNVLALGSCAMKIDGKKEETFFIIVKSQELINLRKLIWELLDNKMKSEFNPLKFHPHITIGFTKKDLHESNGVVKDSKNSKDQRFELIVN